MGALRLRLPTRLAARLALVVALVCVGRALAAVPFGLPPGESVAEWTVPLGLAGFAPGGAGSGARVRISAAGSRWTVEVTDERGGVHVVTVDRPATPRAREDLVWLAQSLVHPSSSLLSSLPSPPPPVAPAPAAPPPVAPSPAPAPVGAPPRPPAPPPARPVARVAPPTAVPAKVLVSPGGGAGGSTLAPPPTGAVEPADPGTPGATSGSLVPAAAAAADPADPAAADPAASTPPADPPVAPVPPDAISPSAARTSPGGSALPPVDADSVTAALASPAAPPLVVAPDRPSGAVANLDVRWGPEVGLGGGIDVRPGAPAAGDATLRIAARRTGGLGLVLVVGAPGRTVPEVLDGKGTLWGGFAGVGAGWMAEGAASAGVEGGIGASGHYLAYATDLGFDPGTTGLSVSPAVWVSPRVAVPLVGPLVLTLDARAGVDLYAISFYVYDPDTGETSGRGALSRAWAAPTIALSWSR